MTLPLSPTQQVAFDALCRASELGPVVTFTGGSGMGKTTVLRQLAQTCGAKVLSARDLVAATQPGHPRAIEESLATVLLEPLGTHATVAIDDFGLLCDAMQSGGGLLLATAAAAAADSGKRLVLGGPSRMPPQAWYTVALGDLKQADYEHFGRVHLSDAIASRVDFARVYRFAPRLSARQLRAACTWTRADAKLNTDRFIEYLRSQGMAGNVDLVEVPIADFADLKGVDDVIESLNAHLLTPFENDATAAEFGLKPKRGVLLYGPPGTGKTTIGRALAHRLRGKFFLVDGRCVPGTDAFHSQIESVFESAKGNSPAVVFIDDCDALFESGEEYGFYRYLLTQLDGLEASAAGRLYVILTAMDLANVPPALLRSGRIELWMEMRLPDETCRDAILRQELADVPPSIGRVDIGRLATSTQNLTGADLKRLVADAKALFAFDRAKSRAPRPSTEYFLDTVELIRNQKQKYAVAEARARERYATRPSYFSTHFGNAGSAFGE